MVKSLFLILVVPCTNFKTSVGIAIIRVGPQNSHNLILPNAYMPARLKLKTLIYHDLILQNGIEYLQYNDLHSHDLCSS